MLSKEEEHSDHEKNPFPSSEAALEKTTGAPEKTPGHVEPATARP